MEAILARWGFAVDGVSAFKQFEDVTFDEKMRRYGEIFETSNLFAGDQVNRVFLQRASCFPIMAVDGTFHPFYAHVVFGLFLNQILKSVCHPDVSLNVLCMGWKFETAEVWFRNKITGVDEIKKCCKRVAGYVFESDAFQQILHDHRAHSVKKKHVRTIVWLMRCGHAFAVGWNVSSLSGGGLFLEVFILNCIDNDQFALCMVEKFSEKLGELYSLRPKIHLSSLVHAYDIGVLPDTFPCVPYMGRATLYASMISDLCLGDSIDSLAKKIDINDEKKLFLHFEKILLEFCEENIVSCRRLLLPLNLNDVRFLNIDDLWLESMSISSYHSISYVFNGFVCGFVE